MATPNVLILRAAGINCDEETAFAWEQAGATPTRLHVRRLIEQPRALDAYQILTVPGGFSYGDDIASGKVLATQLANHLGERLAAFVDRGGLILGICNGFQVLVRLGLLPGSDCSVRVTLATNDSGRYEDRWVRLVVDASPCVFVTPGDRLMLPIAHAEGKIIPEGGIDGIGPLRVEKRVALRYIAADGGEPGYPENPNGSIGNVAGLTDATGRVLGLMPHPERNILPTHAPDLGGDSSIANQGRRIFANAVRYFA